MDKLWWTRLRNRLGRELFERVPGIYAWWAHRYRFVQSQDIPWTPLGKPLRECKLALITTGGVHLRSQPPFDMMDPDGDPTYRCFPVKVPQEELTITHDYYDHRDADRDINILLPRDRAIELAAGGELGSLHGDAFSFMGHIDKHHVRTLVEYTAPEVAQVLYRGGVDIALLTPA